MQQSPPPLSYAQNREDILLARVFGGVGGAEGFWIDVGANDPVVDSVTKYFSLRGWRGVNVEPVRACFERLDRDRPRDVNIHAAVGSQRSTLTLRRVATHDALSTFDPRLAQMYIDDGHDVVDEIVPVVTLASVWDEHVTGPVHFLKIDVEGHEAAVVAGADFARHRPWVVMIEATYPELWRSKIESAGYRFALDDGINFVFVANEHAELVEKLTRPVTSLDPHLPYHLRADGSAHDAFVRRAAITTLADAILRGATDQHERDAAAVLAGIVTERIDLTAAFAPNGRLDVHALLRWTLETSADADSHLPLLVQHRPALHQLLRTNATD